MPWGARGLFPSTMIHHASESCCCCPSPSTLPIPTNRPPLSAAAPPPGGAAATGRPRVAAGGGFVGSSGLAHHHPAPCWQCPTRLHTPPNAHTFHSPSTQPCTLTGDHVVHVQPAHRGLDCLDHHCGRGHHSHQPGQVHQVHGQGQRWVRKGNGLGGGPALLCCLLLADAHVYHASLLQDCRRLCHHRRDLHLLAVVRTSPSIDRGLTFPIPTPLNPSLIFLFFPISTQNQVGRLDAAMAPALDARPACQVSPTHTPTHPPASCPAKSLTSFPAHLHAQRIITID